MPVLTTEEYNKTKKTKNRSVKKQVDDKKIQPVLNLQKKVYYLLYPENSMFANKNGELKLNLNENGKLKEHMLKIVNGIVKTDRKDIADYLKSIGYIFIKEEIK